MTTPGSGRPEDVAGARELVETALRDGYATLATVRENDLCVLNSTAAVLVDTQAWARWMAFTDEQRALMRWSSIGILIASGLLRPHPGAYVPQPEDVVAASEAGVTPELSQYDVAPELATALLARERPVFVVAGSASPQAKDEWAPKLYGMADETQHTLTVVLEQVFAKSFGRFGHEVRFMLLSPAKAAEVLISWLCVAPRSRWSPGQRDIRIITNPVSGTDVHSWTATPAKNGWSVQAERSGPGAGGDLNPEATKAEATKSEARVDDAESMSRLADDLVAAMTGWAG